MVVANAYRHLKAAITLHKIWLELSIEAQLAKREKTSLHAYVLA